MFSVVIPVYNHDKYLDEALVSVLSDNLVSEVLIADDGSRDRSAQIIELAAKRFPGKVRNLTEKPAVNVGAHAMLNRLTNAVRNDWVAVLNSDDKFVPGRFSVIRNLSKMFQFDFCFGNLAIIDGDSTTIGRKRAFLDPQYPFPPFTGEPVADKRLLLMMFSQNYIATTSNMLFKKSLWEQVGGFRDYRYAHDWDFAIRCMMQGKVRYIAEYLTYYRVHGSNTISESRTLQDIEIRKIFKVLEDDLSIDSVDSADRFLRSNQYL